MQQTLISLTKEFIAIESTPDNAKALQNILELVLSHLEGFTIERFERNGVKSALVYNAKSRPKKFEIILNAHLDIIPGKAHQYTPEIKGNQLYGVGSMDMKASVACLIVALKEVAAKVPYPIALQLTTDEEIGGFDSTKYQIEEGVAANFVIAAEPTNFDIVNKAKGILQIKITAPGKAAHGAYPWKGENAAWRMNDFLNTLKQEFPPPTHESWSTTINLSRIETSNQAFNKVPDQCVVWLDVRFIPEETKTINARIQRLMPKDFTLDVTTDEPALLTDENNKFIKKLQSSAEKMVGKEVRLRGANGSSDARHFTLVDCPGIEFGPIGDGMGSDHEWVDIPGLENYTRILEDFLLSL